MNTPEMHGRAAVVTGGASGLGLAVTRLLCEHGARVAVIDSDEIHLTAALDDLRRTGHEVAGIAGSIVARTQAEWLFERAMTTLGNVDALVNCAGVYPRVPLLEITDEDWDASIGVNVRGTYNMMAAAARHMRPHRAGRMVNISSIDAYKAHPPNAHYAAGKAAVVSLTRSFALELAPDQILVNAVAPGAIATEKAKAAGWLPEFAAHTPLGRVAEPRDIAEVVLFLAGPRNRYMTGETVIVSGGGLMR